MPERNHLNNRRERINRLNEYEWLFAFNFFYLFFSASLHLCLSGHPFYFVLVLRATKRMRNFRIHTHNKTNKRKLRERKMCYQTFAIKIQISGNFSLINRSGIFLWIMDISQKHQIEEGWPNLTFIVRKDCHFINDELKILNHQRIRMRIRMTSRELDAAIEKNMKMGEIESSKWLLLWLDICLNNTQKHTEKEETIKQEDKRKKR